MSYPSLSDKARTPAARPPVATPGQRRPGGRCGASPQFQVDQGTPPAHGRIGAASPAPARRGRSRGFAAARRQPPRRPAHDRPGASRRPSRRCATRTEPRWQCAVRRRPGRPVPARLCRNQPRRDGRLTLGEPYPPISGRPIDGFGNPTMDRTDHAAQPARSTRAGTCSAADPPLRSARAIRS